MPDDEDNQEDKGSRMDAAKAFFRAMYAGDEPQPQQQSAPPSEADSRRVKELEAQVGHLEQKAAEAENLYRRMAADFDNFRRRMDRDRDELGNAGIRKVVEAIIPALDDLDRALTYLTPETPADKVIESFKLVANRINQCLETAGLKRLKCIGEQFDPRFHEPVQQLASTEHVDGSIMHELRGGYVLGERVIRPAMVTVAQNDAMPAPPPPPKTTSEQAMPGAGNKTSGEHQAASSAQTTSTPQDAVAQAKTEEESSKTDDSEKAKATASTAKEDGVYDLGNLDDF
jgi:molecular chaperone GrpE